MNMNDYDSMSSRKLIARDRLSFGVDDAVHSSKTVLASSATSSTSCGFTKDAGAETDRDRFIGCSVRSMTLTHLNIG